MSYLSVRNSSLSSPIPIPRPPSIHTRTLCDLAEPPLKPLRKSEKNNDDFNFSLVPCNHISSHLFDSWKKGKSRNHFFPDGAVNSRSWRIHCRIIDRRSDARLATRFSFSRTWKLVSSEYTFEVQHFRSILTDEMNGKMKFSDAHRIPGLSSFTRVHHESRDDESTIYWRNPEAYAGRWNGEVFSMSSMITLWEILQNIASLDNTNGVHMRKKIIVHGHGEKGRGFPKSDSFLKLANIVFRLPNEDRLCRIRNCSRMHDYQARRRSDYFMIHLLYVFCLYVLYVCIKHPNTFSS